MKFLVIPTALLALSSCTSAVTERLIPQTEYVQREIPIQPRPAPVEMPPVDWYVVNNDNIDEFLARVESDVGNVVFIAVTPKGYENLALGIADLRRFINQQSEIILYYEEQAQPQENPS